MPTVEINRAELEKLVGKSLPEDKLKERISYLGTDLEKIEKGMIVVEVFPNRPDMLSEQGFARALSSFIGVKTGLREYHVKSSGHKVIIDKSVAGVRPYTACAIVKGLKLDGERIREIIQIQEKLHVTYGRNRRRVAIGIYPLEKIKPPIRYLARKPGEIKFQPLETDKDMTANEILAAHPAGKEYGHLLKGAGRYPVFIDANKNVLSMPPIINSNLTGRVTESTKDVFIECSGFDFDVLSKCLNIIVTALADMGGSICSMTLEYPGKKHVTPDLKSQKMKIDIGYVNRLLGLELKETDLKKLLERMGHGYHRGYALIPAYRADILHPVDLVEDAAIAYGYENFSPGMSKISTIGGEDEYEILSRKISHVMAGLGCIEASTYHISNPDNLASKMDMEMPFVKLTNSKSGDYTALRPWLLPGLMDVLSANKSNEYPQRIFEIGTVFRADRSEETGVRESPSLAFVASHKDTNYTEARQVIDALLASLGLEGKVTAAEHKSFIPGRAGAISVKGKEMGFIGELSPIVLGNWGLEQPVAGFEINMEAVYQFLKKPD